MFLKVKLTDYCSAIMLITFSALPVNSYGDDAALYTDRELCNAGWNQSQIDNVKGRVAQSANTYAFSEFDSLPKTVDSVISISVAKQSELAANIPIPTGKTPPFFPDPKLNRWTLPIFTDLSDSFVKTGENVLLSIDAEFPGYSLLVFISINGDVVVARPTATEKIGYGKWLFETMFVEPVGCETVYVIYAKDEVSLNNIIMAKDETVSLIGTDAKKIDALVRAVGVNEEVGVDFRKFQFYVGR